MFELRFAGGKTFSAMLEPGLYRLELPESVDLAGELEKLMSDQKSALSCSPSSGRGDSIWLPQTGGLISNLRVWENVVLPRWYHTSKLEDGLEEDTLAKVKALLPAVGDPALWLHRTIGQLPEDERAIAGLLRSVLAPAHWLFIEADWANALDSAQFQLCCRVLQQELQTHQRVAFVFGSDAQALNALVLWDQFARPLNWITV